MIKLPKRTFNILFYLSLLLIIVGASLYLYQRVVAGYLMTVGGAMLAICFVAMVDKSRPPRVRRLNRMGFFGSLAYICAGGLVLSLSNAWILLFTVGTILVIYSLLVRPTKRKRPKSH